MRLGHYRHVSTPTLLSRLDRRSESIIHCPGWAFDLWLAAMFNGADSCHVQEAFCGPRSDEAGLGVVWCWTGMDYSLESQRGLVAEGQRGG